MPPTILRTKRKREDDPVEVIFIEGEAPSHKKNRTAEPLTYRRVPSSISNADFQRTLAGAGISPTGRVLFQEIVASDGSESPDGSREAKSASTARLAASKKPSPKASKDPLVSRVSNHRQYRISKPKSEPVASLAAAHAGKMKRHDIGGSALALTPTGAANVKGSDGNDQPAPQSDATMLDAESGQAAPAAAARPLKRPLVSQAERRFRDQNWSAPQRSAAPVPDAATSGDDTLVRLAHELATFAMEEMARSDGSDQRDVHMTTAGLKPSAQKLLKYPPKPSPPRYHERYPSGPTPDGRRSSQSSSPDSHLTDEARDVEMAMGSDSASQGGSDEWVYDIFVRGVGTGRAFAGGASRLPAVESQDEAQQHGLLVLTEEDSQLWWETWGDDDDEKALSDDEDENAEDYYTNDYPDEEDLSDEDSHGSDAWSDEADEDSDDE